MSEDSEDTIVRVPLLRPWWVGVGAGLLVVVGIVATVSGSDGSPEFPSGLTELPITREPGDHWTTAVEFTLPRQHWKHGAGSRTECRETGELTITNAEGIVVFDRFGPDRNDAAISPDGCHIDTLVVAQIEQTSNSYTITHVAPDGSTVSATWTARELYRGQGQGSGSPIWKLLQ